MQFDVLGPIRITDGNGTRPVTGTRQRILLAALLAHAKQPMSAGKLAEFVWDGKPPARPVSTLRTYLTRLRQELGPVVAARIRTVNGGYLAEVGPGELDVLAFEALCRKAGTAAGTADWTAVADHAAAALALWRGDPLEDVPSQMLRGRWLPGLEQQHLQAAEWQAEAWLQLGRHEQLIQRLRQLTAEHPLRERFHAQLMRALACCGRQAEALAVYRDARKVLVEELGIDPGPELRGLHKRILDGDDALSAQPPGALAPETLAAPAPGVPAPVTASVPGAPRQLPGAAGYFTGRRSELDLITGLSERAGARGGTVVIAEISGMAGVGKTALAVHAAHQLADRFPDGQFFIDLHGYTEGQLPREPGEVLGALLRGLGVPAAQIPDQAEECAALWRQRLAGTRTLIVLDNARNAAQVRLLLPGSPGCLVLLTSRRRLKSLHDAHVVALDVLPDGDATALLAALTGTARAGAGGPGLAEIADLCGRLPLALRIAGALLRHRPAWTPGYLASLLRDENQRLATLHGLDAVFDLSYAALDARQQLLFRRLALAPGPDLEAYAAAALLDDSPPATARLLESLVDHNLLIEHAPGRYRPHDLIRVHARALAASDPQADRDSALDRLLHYYAHAAQCASARVARYSFPAPDGPVPAYIPALNGYETARAWLLTERGNLLAAHAQARNLALDSYTVALAAGMAEILRANDPFALALELSQATASTIECRGWHAARATALADQPTCGT